FRGLSEVKITSSAKLAAAAAILGQSSSKFRNLGTQQSQSKIQHPASNIKNLTALTVHLILFHPLAVHIFCG
ncbi:MAG: hypothetical protein EBY81_00890, partial [Verrucomicrobia bacterium]|nr:hypothetical protein [Verrucomicrobiota bacterium]